MYKKVLYCCEKCDFTSQDPEEVLSHELNHVGLTPALWKEYMQLQKAVRDAGRTVFYTKNKETDAAFSEAAEKVVDFEKKHKVPEEIIEKYRY